MSAPGSPPPKADDFKSILADAIDAHGKATAGIIEKWGKTGKVDVVKETAACFDRVLSTSAKFIVFWDNIATLMAMDDLPPINHPPPPVGGPGLKATTQVEAPGLSNATVGSGLRRRGDPPNPPSVDPSKIALTKSPSGFTVEVDCDGVPRGLYEGVISGVDAAGTPQNVRYNVYVNPV